jgi:hypothetical protein
VETIPAGPSSRPETEPEEHETVTEAAPGSDDLLQRVAGTLADIDDEPGRWAPRSGRPDDEPVEPAERSGRMQPPGGATRL